METKTIDDLLVEIREDKSQNFSTTSYKFKTDLWEFFQGFGNKNAVEYGTHKGQTTRILSHLFNQVITFNLPNHFEEAERLNSDRENITYIGVDLYASDPTEPIDGVPNIPVSVFFDDAVHSFDAVMHGFMRSTHMKLDSGDVYFVFDDYGMIREVFQAVNQLIFTKQLELVKYIGHPPRHSFGGHPERVLFDHEGVIAKLLR